MNTFIVSKINERFFKALEMVINARLIRGVQTFTNEHNIDRRNLLKVKSNPSSQRVCLEWIYYLSTDFNISADWILTGKGTIFKQ